jgi:hypothetical protein
MVDMERLASKVSDGYSSHLAYTSSHNAAYLASFKGGATRGVGVASYDSSALSDLKIAGVVTSNSTQDAVADAFTTSDVPVRQPPIVLTGGSSAGWMADLGQASGNGFLLNLNSNGADQQPLPVQKSEKVKAPAKKKIKQKSARW